LLRNIVFIGGPRDGISTWMDNPQWRILSSDLHGFHTVWHEYIRIGDGQGDTWGYEFKETHDGPMTYAVDVLDHWLEQQFPSGYKGWMADVGAYDGITGSNSFYLEELGWTCLCVEPNGHMLNELKLRRPLVEHCACSDHEGTEVLHVHDDNPPSFTSLRDNRTVDQTDPRFGSHNFGFGANWSTQEVRVRTLDDLLQSHGFPQLDVLSVDTEGTELDVLKGCDLDRWRPQVIVCEAWDHVSPIIPYLHDRHYRFIDRRGVNNLFLREQP
jgi:FkbM family methyltransferase